MIAIHDTPIVEYKTLRAEPSVRVLFDLGEVSSETVKQLHEHRISHDCCIIVCSANEYVTIMDKLKGPVAMELRERVNGDTPATIEDSETVEELAELH